jgi:hypothetical protein
MQPSAYPSNGCWITRNEQVSGSSPFVGSLTGLLKPNTLMESSSATHYWGLMIPLAPS